jgi:hypothetical protein
VPFSTPLPLEDMARDRMSSSYFSDHLKQGRDFDGAQMPDLDVGLIIAHASRLKNAKPSAYTPDPLSITTCISSPNWQTSNHSENTRWEAILNEIANFKKNKVYTIVSKRIAQDSQHNIFPTLIHFLTKRTKHSTPKREMINKRKCRIVFASN